MKEPLPTYAIAGLLAQWHSLLLICTRCAAAHQMRLWLVGGVVRDLLQGNPSQRDLDLAVDGDPALLVPPLLAALGARVQAQHAAFGTATLAIPRPAAPDLLLDLARTRREHYPQPAALPVVQPADIHTDLARRDFSINAMAIELHAAPQGDALYMGDLLDPFGGQADLRAGVLRLLHANSLRDDPTRLLRGVRLAARRGFSFDPTTHHQISTALAAGYLRQLTPERIRTELCLALEEPDPAAVVQHAAQLDLLPLLVPGLRWQPADADLLHRARQHADPLVVAGVLLWQLAPAERAALCQHYRLDNQATRLLSEISALQAALPSLTTVQRDSQLDTLLQPFHPRTLQVAALCAPAAQAHIQHYQRMVQLRRPHLNGHDLQRLGVPAGPDIGRVLGALRAAVLDGHLTSRADEEAWVQAQLTGEHG